MAVECNLLSKLAIYILRFETLSKAPDQANFYFEEKCCL